MWLHQEEQQIKRSSGPVLKKKNNSGVLKIHLFIYLLIHPSGACTPGPCLEVKGNLEVSVNSWGVSSLHPVEARDRSQAVRLHSKRHTFWAISLLLGGLVMRFRFKRRVKRIELCSPGQGVLPPITDPSLFWLCSVLCCGPRTVWAPFLRNKFLLWQMSGLQPFPSPLMRFLEKVQFHSVSTVWYLKEGAYISLGYLFWQYVYCSPCLMTS